MLSVKALRKIDPDLDVSDEELENVAKSIYEFGHLMFDDFQGQKFSSKFPRGLLTTDEDKHTI